MEVIALRRFSHNGKRQPGEAFSVSPQIGKELARKGLVRAIEEQVVPPASAGGKSSASPADPASPQTTATPSRRGGRKKKAEA